jgi:hypothetical protein
MSEKPLPEPSRSRSEAPFAEFHRHYQRQKLLRYACPSPSE